MAGNSWETPSTLPAAMALEAGKGERTRKLASVAYISLLPVAQAVRVATPSDWPVLMAKRAERSLLLGTLRVWLAAAGLTGPEAVRLRVNAPSAGVSLRRAMGSSRVSPNWAKRGRWA